MTSKIARFSVALAACGFVLGSCTGALAINDHLKCYKAKEISGPGRVQYSASFVSGVGLNTESGCLIKGPPKMVCAPVTQTGVVPTPPGGGPTRAASTFFCYKVKCPRGPSQSISKTDQFGTHTLTLKNPKMVCLPASPSGAFLDDASLF